MATKCCVGIFAEHGEFSRAADLYAQGGLFEKSADTFVLAERYNDGASTLARGNMFDGLVLYLNKYVAGCIPHVVPHVDGAN